MIKSNSNFIKYYRLILGKASKPAIKLIDSKPDRESNAKYDPLALARSLRVFYSFYVGVLVGKNKLTSHISKVIEMNLYFVNDILDDNAVVHKCKGIITRYSPDDDMAPAYEQGYEKEFYIYQRNTLADRQQCYRDIQRLKPLKEF